MSNFLSLPTASSFAMDGSATQSPGGETWKVDYSGDDNEVTRNKPRTFPYHSLLPYDVEDNARRNADLDNILKHLYISVQARDLSPGALHWTRELKAWLELKFDLTRATRKKLVHLYFELALARGIDTSIAERFANMFTILLKRKHYLRPGKDLVLDWRPLWTEIKAHVIPVEIGLVQNITRRKSLRTLIKLTYHAYSFFDPNELEPMFKELLPYFSTSVPEFSFITSAALMIMLPCGAPPPENNDFQPKNYLPALFHLWSLVNRSKLMDVTYLDLLSRIARENLMVSHVPFGRYGMFTEEQAQITFTAILRLLEIPVGQSASAYSSSTDHASGLGLALAKDQRKNPPAHACARWIVMSLSPECVNNPKSIMGNLQGLIEAVETFFHPSNSGNWTKTLCQLLNYLAEFFTMRWNREQSGELPVAENRKLTPELRREFVLCLRDVTFMGIYSKSSTAMGSSLLALKHLAYLEPELILPGALQRIYPSMQGLVEVHRTTSSLKALKYLARTIIRTKGFRCHLTTLLSLALPGIDANDLDKTLNTLQFIQAVSYEIPLYDMDEGQGAMLAMEWVNGEMERLETGGATVMLNYDQIPDDQEAAILRSSTAGFGEFITLFIGRIFTLLENLPDAAKIRTNSPEETVVSTLPSVLMPFFATLAPELYDIALHKIADFATNHVINQARDAMAYIVNALCRANPEKALKKFVPILIRNIYDEIEENGAASTRHTGSDVLPRDRGLLWHISLLSMCAIHVGDEVLKYDALFKEVIYFMQERCKGIASLHVSNLVHHIFLNTVTTYTLEMGLLSPEEKSKEITPANWGVRQDPKKLDIKWHVPSRKGLEFATELYETLTEKALAALNKLIESPSAAREGAGKEWSDDVSRNLTLLRLLISGISSVFESKTVSDSSTSSKDTEKDQEMKDPDADADGDEDGSSEDGIEEEGDSGGDDANNDDIKPSFVYPTGYMFEDDKSDPLCVKVHDLRVRSGEMLHRVHGFLVKYAEDDVPCFNALYTAYRTFIIDVGLEKSAHTLDRVMRLLAHDLRPYKMFGICKDYPRPLLVRRAALYHLQRVQRKAGARKPTELEISLVMDLAESCVSLYTEIRRHAQSAIESSIRVLVGAKRLVIPRLLDSFEEALQSQEPKRIKGAMYSLLFGNIGRAVGKDWNFAPRLIKAFIASSTADKPSIQKLANAVTYTVMEFGRERERLALFDESKIRVIAPAEDLLGVIAKKRAQVTKKSKLTEERKQELAVELVDIANQSHWKTAVRTATILFNLGLRFGNVASDSFLDLVMKGIVDSHPGLRNIFAGIANATFCYVILRAMCQHDYHRYVADQLELPGRVKITTDKNDPNWTNNYLESFKKPDTKVFIDMDFTGWLVWPDTFNGFEPHATKSLEWDDVETHVRERIASHVTVDWIKLFFEYLKQEPRDNNSDKFRLSFVTVLGFVFTLVADGITPVTFEEVKTLTGELYGDGSDKHQHRAMSEVLSALISAYSDRSQKETDMMWGYVMPILKKVFEDGLNPENFLYWQGFLHNQFETKDVRRSWPIVEYLSAFRLDMNSNAAFKESSKIQLLNQIIADCGWHFQLQQPIVDDFLKHLDHPYKGVREQMGDVLSSAFRTRYHESFMDVKSFMKAQADFSSVGTLPYAPNEEFTRIIEDVFKRLAQWRAERPPGQQSPSSYTAGSKTVLGWLDTTLVSYECTQLVPYFHQYFLREMLHMMDVKEDMELMTLAYHVFRNLPNIPIAVGHDAPFISAMIDIGKTSEYWHQRLRVLMNMQVLYFRRLFLINDEDQLRMFSSVSSMLEDAQLEVRLGASTTLSGMIRCSPVRLRDLIIEDLKRKFTDMLRLNPIPRKQPVGTPTPQQTRTTVIRHAAVLGLGALAQAFPYHSPPPVWLPEVLAVLASKASSDPGMVGKSVKTVLSDFKKTRQDTWHVDVKVFTPDQLDDLEGVLWKSYFA